MDPLADRWCGQRARRIQPPEPDGKCTAESGAFSFVCVIFEKFKRGNLDLPSFVIFDNERYNGCNANLL